MSGDDGGLGNFKGVMLCNRPVGPRPTAATGGAGAASQPPFVSAVVPPQPLGFVPKAKKEASKAVKKKKEDDVTWRHKQWLGEFASQKKQIDQVMENRAQRQQDKKEQFAERSAMMRAAVRNLGEDDEEGAEKAFGLLNGTTRPEEMQEHFENVQAQQEIAEAEYARAQTEQYSREAKQAAGSAAAQERRARKQTKKKPVWALNETEAEEFEDEQVEGLVDFASNLDFDEYMDDLEVREAVKFVRDRVRTLQISEEEKERRAKLVEEREQARAERAERLAKGEEIPEDMEQLANMQDDRLYGISSNGDGGDQGAQSKRRYESDYNPNTDDRVWNSSTRVDDEKKQQVTDEVKMRLGQVHSNASVTKLVEQTRKLASQQAEQAAASAGPNLAVPHPVVSTTMDRESIVNNDVSKDPANLPFLRRHPAL